MCKATRLALQALVEQHGARRVDFAIVDAAWLGTPQLRRRYIIGSPALVAQLRAMPCAPRRSIRDVFAQQGRVPPATHVRNTTARGVRSVEDVAFTCCASRALTWCTADGATVRSMSPSDTRVLMGLPPSFRLVGGQRREQRVLGNGIAFHVARAIAACARRADRGA